MLSIPERHDRTVTVDGEGLRTGIPMAIAAGIPGRWPEALVERFEIGRFLGEGGMCDVYVARHRTLGREYAVKVTRAGDARAKRRLLNEAQALHAVADVGIPEVVDVGSEADDDGLAYLVMEKLSGRALSELLRRGDVFDVQGAVALTRRVLAILSIVHAHGLVHRDVKPGNVLWDCKKSLTDGVHLIDFGIAFSVGVEHADVDGPEIAGWAGTRYYMAPEQRLGGMVDHRADIYAAGLLLLELLRGSVPAPTRRSLSAEDDEERDGVMEHDLAAIEDPELRHVLGRALRYAASARYETASELAQALAPFCGASPAITVEDAGLKALRRRVRREVVGVELRRSVHGAPVVDVPMQLERCIDAKFAGLFGDDHVVLRSDMNRAIDVMQVVASSRAATLILGRPGSGKSVWLMRVADALLKRAEHQGPLAAPIPVPIPLAGYFPHPGGLLAWLALAIARRWGLRERVARNHLQHARIIPLIDGLDELSPRLRTRCLEQFHEHFIKWPQLRCFVTCRSEVWEQHRGEIRRDFGSVVTLLGLLDAQVDALLTYEHPSEEAEMRREAISRLPPAKRTPLAVRLIRDAPLETLRDVQSTSGYGGEHRSVRELQRNLTQAQIQRRLCGLSSSVQAATVEDNLRWLAQRLQGLSLNSYAPGDIQPIWLNKKGRYLSVSRLICAIPYALACALAFGCTPLDNWGLSGSFQLALELGIVTLLVVAATDWVYSSKNFRENADGLSRPYTHRRGILWMSALLMLLVVPTFGWPVIPILIEIAMLASVLIGPTIQRSSVARDIDLERWARRIFVLHPRTLAISVSIVGAICTALWFGGLFATLYEFLGVCAIGLAGAFVVSVMRASSIDEGMHATEASFSKTAIEASMWGLGAFVVSAFAVSSMYSMTYALQFAAAAAMFFALRFGGRDLVCAGLLRFHLRRQKRDAALWAQDGWIESALSVGLLRREGERICFAERAVLDYFAQSHIEESSPGRGHLRLLNLA